MRKVVSFLLLLVLLAVGILWWTGRQGARLPAWRVETDIMGFTARIWVNDEGEELRGEVPMGPITLETVREPYETAVGEGWSEDTRLDLVNLAAIPARTMLIEGARQVDSMSVRLSGVDFSEFEITFGRQELIEEAESLGKNPAGLGCDLGNRGKTQRGVCGVNNARHGEEDSQIRNTLQLAHTRSLQSIRSDHGWVGVELLEVLDDCERLDQVCSILELEHR